jgi:hypothetical protein
MLEMLKAHGLDPGPTQRPLLAGAIAGVLSDVPALALLALLPCHCCSGCHRSR